MTFDQSAVSDDLGLFTARGLLDEHEAAQVLEVVGDAFPFGRAMSLAESVHVHVTVDSVDELPGLDSLATAAAEAQFGERERKFVFDSGLNVIFADEPTAQDELIPGAVTRPKPYVDHLGIDLRDETTETKAVFDSIPDMAGTAGWRHVHQSGPVRCCHTEMGPKHWVYPPEGPSGHRRPIEFAYGELKATDEYIGCDYRPIDPAHPLASEAASIAACGQPAAETEGTRPQKVYVFEECSCNTSASWPLIELLQQRYGDEVDVRAFDLAKPTGLLPLPPALFMQLQGTGSRVLPALVVDGEVRMTGGLPSLEDAVTVVEGSPEARAALLDRTASATSCCSTDSCC
jgi:hypothetical protein